MSIRQFTSESVTEGHPDKIRDQIADHILDELLKQDPQSRCACEVTAEPGGVHIMGEITSSAHEDIGAGDQDMMFGFACNETSGYMPLPIQLANVPAYGLTHLRKTAILPHLRPDGKSQFTVEYQDGKPTPIEAIVLSAQHDPDAKMQDLREDICENLIYPMIPSELMDKEAKVYIHPTGRFVPGGPAADTGLTGRKIIADT